LFPRLQMTLTLPISTWKWSRTWELWPQWECPLGNESVFTLRGQLRLLGPTIVDTISIITDQAHNCIYHTGEYRIVGCPGYRWSHRLASSSRGCQKYGCSKRRLHRLSQ
jgi:hypothetical protein